MTAPKGFGADADPPYGDDRGPTDVLNEALRDLLEAAKRVQRLTGANVNVDLHKVSEADFFGADHIESAFDGEDGSPSYGHVKGHEHAYLSRLIYRGDGVLYQLFASVAPTQSRSGTRSWTFV
jgi:hypothetical protein